MQTSTNLQMNLPELTDVADITKLTANFSILDTFAGKTVTTDGQNQHITGLKIFDDYAIYRGGSGGSTVVHNSPSLVMTTKPTSQIQIQPYSINSDNGSKQTYFEQILFNTDGSRAVRWNMYDINGNRKITEILQVDANGVSRMYGHTPNINGLNDTSIPTLEYLNSESKATYLVHRAGKESLTGHKVMSEVSYANGHGILVGYMPASTQGGYKLLTTISLGPYYGVYLDITMGGGAEPLSFKRVHVSRRGNPNRAVAVCIESHTYGADETSVWVKYNDDGTIGLYLPEVRGINTNVYQYAISYGSGYATDGNGYSNICTRVTDTALVHLSALPDGCVEMIHAVDRNPKMVTTDGEQTITGFKKFGGQSNTPFYGELHGNGSAVSVKNLDYTKDDGITRYYSGVYIKDANENLRAGFYPLQSTDGSTTFMIRTKSANDEAQDIRINNRFDMSNNVVTKGYVESTDGVTNNLVHRTTFEYIEGQKNFRTICQTERGNDYRHGGWLKYENQNGWAAICELSEPYSGPNQHLVIEIYSHSSANTGLYQVSYATNYSSIQREVSPNNNIKFAIVKSADNRYFIAMQSGQNEVIKYEIKACFSSYVNELPSTRFLMALNWRTIPSEDYTVLAQTS